VIIMRRTRQPSRLSIENGAVVVATPYDPALERQTLWQK